MSDNSKKDDGTNNYCASEKRLQQMLKEKEGGIASLQETIQVLLSTVDASKVKVKEVGEEVRQAIQEKAKVEKQASDGVSKV